MPFPATIRDIDDPGFLEKEWRFQRVAWVLVLVFLVVAAVGLLGAGPLSRTTVTSEDRSIAVDYERFVRHVGSTVATIELGPDAVSNGKATLKIARDLTEGWRIQSVSPAPSAESSTEDWLIYEFDALGDTPPVVRVLYRGDGLGPHQGEVRSEESGASVDVWQWVHP